MITRREMVKLTSLAWVAAATGAFGGRVVQGSNTATALEQAGAPFALPPLPYAFDALEPYIDAQTMEIHHDRHHQAYVNNLNNAVANRKEVAGWSLDDLLRKLDAVPEDIRTAVRNNGGGHFNHSLFWQGMKKGGSTPAAGLAKAIDAAFGSYDKFKDALATQAMGVFGSGWAWLSLDGAGKLLVEKTSNQDSPIAQGHAPLLGLDVWEHAYYLKYQNRRREYVDAFFNVINWDFVQERFNAAKK